MRKNRGWVPDQHGAWVMVLVPVLMGSLFYPAWLQVPLFVAWMAGYFAFFALSLLLKVRGPRRRRYVPALAVYGGTSIVASIATLAFRPSLLWFAPVFAPLVAIAVWEAYRRRPRSLASGISTVLASSAMLPVTAVAGGAAAGDVWPHTLITAMYFCGTIPYVKTLIRKKGDQHWLVGSVLYHLLCVLVVGALAWFGFAPWWVVVIFGAYALRAWWMPYSAGRGRTWRPRDVGIGELFSTIALVCVLLAL